MNKLRVTWRQFLRCRPCYEPEQLAELERRWPDNGVTALEVIDCEEFPVADRLWLVLRPKFIQAKTLHLLACDFAERALEREQKAGSEPDARSWNAIKWKRLWVTGNASDKELAAAEAAAWEAWAAARAAEAAAWEAWAAARAAEAAAWEAEAEAWAAARAARAAAEAAAWGASRAAEAAAWGAADAAARSDGIASDPWVAKAKEMRWQLTHVREVLASEEGVTNGR